LDMEHVKKINTTKKSGTYKEINVVVAKSKIINPYIYYMY